MISLDILTFFALLLIGQFFLLFGHYFVELSRLLNAEQWNDVRTDHLVKLGLEFFLKGLWIWNVGYLCLYITAMTVIRVIAIDFI